MMTTMSDNKFVEFSETHIAPQTVAGIATGPITPPADGEVVVKMLAAPINPADINFIQGVYGIKPTLPHSRAGLEGFGRVVESRSDSLVPGDSVIMLRGVGTWGTYLTCPADNLLKVRSDMDVYQAAMLKVNPLTALRVLEGFVTLTPGDWLVQNAANSGVGRCLIALAHARGIKTLNFVRRPDQLHDELTALGADLILGEDDPDAVKTARELLGDGRPNLASNAVGGESALHLMDLLAPGGTMVTFGAMSKQSIKVPNGFLIFKGITLRGLWVTKWLKEATRGELLNAYDTLSQAIADGTLKQAIDATYPLDRITEALTRAQQEHRGGKVLLTLAE